LRKHLSGFQVLQRNSALVSPRPVGIQGNEKRQRRKDEGYLGQGHVGRVKPDDHELAVVFLPNLVTDKDVFLIDRHNFLLSNSLLCR
jgi:hypothetical protein